MKSSSEHPNRVGVDLESEAASQIRFPHLPTCSETRVCITDRDRESEVATVVKRLRRFDIGVSLQQGAAADFYSTAGDFSGLTGHTAKPGQTLA